MIKKIFLLISFALFFFFRNISAQGCCTVGSNTFGGFERGITSEGKLKLGLGFVESILASTYNEIHEIPDPLGRKSRVSLYNMELEYGISGNVSLLIVGGIIVKKREISIFDDGGNSEKILFTSNGLTDITVLGKYSLISPTIVSTLGLSVGGGVKLPIGNNNLKNNGSRLPIDLQSGTGSTDVLLWGNFYKGFLPQGISFSTSFYYRYTGANLDGYRFGDEYIISLISEYSPTDYLTISLSAKSRFSKEDFWGGRFLPSTGGTYHDIIPGLIYYEGAAQIKIFYLLPLYRNVKGIQLVTSTTAGVQIMVNLN
ncbi:MAG: hypothetical protein HYZ10_06480 [Ignavibacteriales bacterium]|nr:hypothetical protein [Ignavibacteriales bacterium]